MKEKRQKSKQGGKTQKQEQREKRKKREAIQKQKHKLINWIIQRDQKNY